jgi:hypothetical protein
LGKVTNLKEVTELRIKSNSRQFRVAILTIISVCFALRVFVVCYAAARRSDPLFVSSCGFKCFNLLSIILYLGIRVKIFL